MRRNPARRLQSEIDRRAGVVAATSEAQANPAASSAAAVSAGAVDSTTGEWVAFGRLDVDVLAGFRLA